jgi:hypothetical protein
MNAELREQRIDCPYLHPFPPARVPKRGGLDVVTAIRHEERECGKSLED